MMKELTGGFTCACSIYTIKIHQRNMAALTQIDMEGIVGQHVVGRLLDYLVKVKLLT